MSLAFRGDASTLTLTQTRHELRATCAWLGFVVAKRGNGEGSIRWGKDGRYEGRYVSGGWQRSVYGKTRKEAAKRLADVQRGGRDDVRPA